MNNATLTLKNVYYSVPASKRYILHDISFTADVGDFIILVGSNGSGKSSLISLINRTYTPATGELFIFNKEIDKYKPQELAKKIVTLTQDTTENLFMEMSIAENARLSQMRGRHLFALENEDEFRIGIKAYLEQFNIGLSERLDMPVNQLSGGERQILVLALQLQHHPDLILLDEHTSALDPKTASLIMEKTYQAISTRQITCMMTTHNLDFALKYGNRLLALNKGKIVHAALEHEKQALTKTNLLNDCY
jgi:putative ABC transport system ATP-binding protein